MTIMFSGVCAGIALATSSSTACRKRAEVRRCRSCRLSLRTGNEVTNSCGCSSNRLSCKSSEQLEPKRQGLPSSPPKKLTAARVQTSRPIRESIEFLSPLLLGILPVVRGWPVILTITHTYHASGHLPPWKTPQDLGRSPNHSLRLPESCPQRQDFSELRFAAGPRS
jgi:hypothetical protein